MELKGFTVCSMGKFYEDTGWDTLQTRHNKQKLQIFGPWRKKACLRGLWTTKSQTSLGIHAFVVLFLNLKHMSQCMRFPTMCYVRLAKAQISLHIHAVWSESLQLASIFYEC